MNVLKEKNSDNKFKLWDPFDERLPVVIEREPPSKAFIESISENQQDPIGVGHNETEGWFLIYGRKRLLAKRAEKSKNKNARIEVKIFENVTIADIPKMAQTENQHRSNNEVTEYQSISALLANKDFGTYGTVAKHLGMTVSQVQGIERRWHKVPKWVYPGIYSGEISISTAKKIGSSKPSIQKELQKKFKKDGSLTSNTVKSTRNVVLKDLMPELMKEPPKVIPVAELSKIAWMIENRTKEEVLAYIDSLKKG